MPKVWVANVVKEATGRRKITCVIQWSGVETLTPADIGLRAIDTISLTPQSIRTTQQPIPIGSVPIKFGVAFGTPGGAGKYQGGGAGSTITLRWAMGSTGTRIAVAQGIGTRSNQGTLTAHSIITGW